MPALSAEKYIIFFHIIYDNYCYRFNAKTKQSQVYKQNLVSIIQQVII